MTPEERIATLEADSRHMREKVDNIDQNVEDIKDNLIRQRGFIAGMMFILVPIWGAVIMAAKTFWDRMVS